MGFGTGKVNYGVWGGLDVVYEVLVIVMVVRSSIVWGLWGGGGGACRLWEMWERDYFEGPATTGKKSLGVSDLIDKDTRAQGSRMTLEDGRSSIIA